MDAIAISFCLDCTVSILYFSETDENLSPLPWGHFTIPSPPIYPIFYHITQKTSTLVWVLTYCPDNLGHWWCYFWYTVVIICIAGHKCVLMCMWTSMDVYKCCRGVGAYSCDQEFIYMFKCVHACSMCTHVYIYICTHIHNICVHRHTHSYQVPSDVFHLCVIFPH